MPGRDSQHRAAQELGVQEIRCRHPEPMHVAALNRLMPQSRILVHPMVERDNAKVHGTVGR